MQDKNDSACATCMPETEVGLKAHLLYTARPGLLLTNTVFDESAITQRMAVIHAVTTGPL